MTSVYFGRLHPIAKKYAIGRKTKFHLKLILPKIPLFRNVHDRVQFYAKEKNNACISLLTQASLT